MHSWCFCKPLYPIVCVAAYLHSKAFFGLSNGWTLCLHRPNVFTFHDCRPLIETMHTRLPVLQYRSAAAAELANAVENVLSALSNVTTVPEDVQSILRAAVAQPDQLDAADADRVAAFFQSLLAPDGYDVDTGSKGGSGDAEDASSAAIDGGSTGGATADAVNADNGDSSAEPRSGIVISDRYNDVTAGGERAEGGAKVPDFRNTGTQTSSAAILQYTVAILCSGITSGLKFGY